MGTSVNVRGADLFETINSLRAVRKFKSAPVEQRKIEIILDAATKAPSATNRQPWEFVVIRDPATKARLAEVLAEGVLVHRTSMLRDMGEAHAGVAFKTVDDFKEETRRAPVLILVCLNEQKTFKCREQFRPLEETIAAHASIYPAIQNMLLAAKGLGLGSLLTNAGTILARDKIRTLLRIPQHIRPEALIYLGEPLKELGPPRRAPFQQLTHYEGW